MRVSASMLALAVAACAPKVEAPKAALGLDCTIPFKDQVAALAAQPNVVAAPEDSAEPYRFYSTADQRTSYLITKPGAPGHPAILMQRAAGGDVVTSGCPYGNAKGYAKIKAYLEGLKAWRRK